ncbi:tubulin polymerization-promoting protein family member 2-like [Bolinopsis microptera]|uniref:tubulin polymerization-promoting protein family member 2-like n=1 Tax=Bolinopsis microptera TaxID=2820187 RepID=UPI0030798FD3
MEATFAAFSKFGDSKSTGKELDNKKLSKLCKDTGIMGKLVTSTDVDICFSKHKPKGGRTITTKEFKALLEDLSVKRFPKLSPEERKAAMEKLVSDKGPQTAGTTKTAKGGATGRLTDTSKYTGSHKERFGADGKGKGLEGRADLADNSGYVGNYKGADTFDGTH